MSLARFNNLGVRYKLQIPNLIYIVLVIGVIFLYFQSKEMITDLSFQQREQNELAEKIRATALSIKAFIGQESDFITLKKDYQALIGSMQGHNQVDVFKSAWEKVERFNEINTIKQNIENNIDEMTKASMQKSNDFIKAVAEKLAGEETRESVSKLERMVIIGANINTSSNYEVMIRFLKMKENPDFKESLLNYLDALLKNVEKDRKNLEGSPYEKMAVAAKELNIKITSQVKDYVKYNEEQQEIQKAIFEQIEKSLTDINTAAIEANQSFFNRIGSFFYIYTLVMVAACIAGILLTWVSVRSITGPIARVSSFARTIKLGDLGNRLVMNRKDEVGQMAGALDEMADSLEEKAEAATSISRGDLTCRVTRSSDRDVLGLALSNMIETLNQLISSIHEAVRQISFGVNQVSGSSQALSSGGFGTSGLPRGDNQFHDRSGRPDENKCGKLFPRQFPGHKSQVHRGNR